MSRREPDDQPNIDAEEERVIVREVIRDSKNGSVNGLAYTIFVIIIVGAGAEIWAQQAQIDSIRTDVAVLKLKCQPNAPVTRGAND